MKEVIWYIHGAASTPLSFTWIKSQLAGYAAYDVAYSADTPIDQTISFYTERALIEQRDIIIIAHSLGGIIGAAIAKNSKNVKKLITMSTPFGGSKSADVLKWVMPNTALYKNIAQDNSTLYRIKNDPPSIPILSFVTHNHKTLMGEKHDGVVSYDSQMAIKNATFIPVALNHFEVLLSPEVMTGISNFLDE